MQGTELSLSFFLFFLQEKTPSVSFERLRALLRGGKSRLSRQADILIVVLRRRVSTGSIGRADGRPVMRQQDEKEKSLSTEEWNGKNVALKSDVSTPTSRFQRCD